MGSEMADDFKRAKELYQWNKSIFSVMGVWPLQKAYVIFFIWTTYLVIHMSMEFVDLYCVFGNLELMVVNLSETTIETITIIKMFVIRFSKTLMTVMVRIGDGIDPKLFDSIEERNIYLNYNRIAKSSFRLWLMMGTTASVMYHMKPLEFRLRAVLGNESMPFVLPYRTRLFIEVNDSATFWIVWICQSPMIYINLFHSVTVGYLFSVVLHVCGHLSALAFRIQNLDIKLRKDPQASGTIFRDIVKRHRYIVSLAKDIDKAFQFLLLEELIISTIILGLTAYSVLVNSDEGDMTTSISFLMYGSTIILLTYGYCVAGEYLITESINVYEAFYQCQWYDLSDSFKKQLMICMIGASKPLQLTGGGFYVYCLASFTGIIKTAMGYISMLRKMI